MLTAFARAFKTPDLRKKLLFTLGIIVIYRLGTHVPIPGVNYKNVQTCIEQANTNSGLFGLVNLFSGGALLQITIFALGILPYITSSIILQLLTVVIPRLEALKKEGQSGTAKITQYTRYLTVALAVLQGTGLVATARSGAIFQGCSVAGDIVPDQSIFTTIVMVLTMTAGTATVMWLGELVTDRGIGNGMSILMFVSIAAGFPGSLWAIKKGGDLAGGWIEFGTVILVGLVMVALVVFVEQAQRRIPVQYAKRMIGRRSYGGTSTYIPLKVNQAGVIPVIFASSLLYIPALIVQFTDSQASWATWIRDNLADTSAWPHVVLYFLLIVFFAFFYVAISFNPEEVADNMKKYGGFIPGIRAGRPTAEYLSYVLNRITWPGSLYLGLIALVPTLALAGFGANSNFPFGGTSILIIVGVGLETVKQIESQLQQRNYEGFLR
ncbi:MULTISPECIES: preprotein translocase subunit SecY [unclassified Streptomyces]|uniref:Protein translocase subunit SecY n=1 Tax=Streptomyces evansiae TaxID=3075535 RepID=A0ABU2QYU7_9ACTN|nr:MULTISPECIES: preprotein translocase subunit SecY [unclassified Streptomyces]MYQ58579.1 preprotein translocase subunit SecY [Streptomyces sp. SID4926]MDT0409203.1 preprotein translocase subunit SecY [Streptomyces sp. DSM 41979]MDT0423051.1 preprotein translocase subunit SecY [Streptomyces sp. DSM 41859]NJA55723.1 preprotein translocase subunit SecY [Streptomyces sp. NEAU-H3]WEH27899.1 preprotein translocase subunit SecY [Streptomyces sp. AM 3-1-1]